MTAAPRVRFGASVWRMPKGSAQTAAPAGPAGLPLSFAAAHWPSQSVQRQQDGSVQQMGGTTMGTTWSLRLVNLDFLPLAPVQALVQDTLDAVVAQMSNWEPDSHISRFNTAPAGSWCPMPPQMAQVMEAALHWAQACNGAWDPTVGALVALWGFGPRAHPDRAHSGTPPSTQAVAQALAQCGYQRLQWDPAGAGLLQPGGMQLDLSGIAKGFAVDWVAERLQAAGWQHALLEIGGEIRAWGQRPEGRPWRVAVAGLAPQAGTPVLPAAVRLRTGALASSGDHWHVFEQGGRRYSHTIDPRTGQPVAHALTSVTVFHPSCMHADALATVLTVLGPQAGWAFALTQQVAAVFHTHADAQHPTGVRLTTPAWEAALGPWEEIK